MRSPFLSLLLLSVACSGTAPTEQPASEGATPAGEEPAPVERPKAEGPSLILVTMDTTRPDHLGAYGYDKAQTPNIDKVAGEGALFERAYAVVPLTTPAHGSMMSGLYPTRTGIHTNGDAILNDEVTTLAEVLHGKGYHTAASVSAFVTTRIWNLDQGFDAYFDKVEADPGARDTRWSRERRAGEVIDDLEGWLAEKPKDEPFFVWAHFYDPHDPYDPPAPFDEQLKGRPYDGEIAYMDGQIGRLRELAEATAGPEGVAIILVADHGEAFGEHDERLHGTFAWDSTMRIPFIVKPAKPLEAGKKVSEVTASNVDVMPTALGLLGLEAPEGVDGQNLSSVVKGDIPARPPVYMEAESAYQRFGFHPEWAAAEGPWKLFATPNPRLFNVDEDPGETKNRLAEQEDIARKLSGFVDEVQAARVVASDFTASQEMIDQLEQLGYMSGENTGAMDLAGTVDAKDQAEVIAKIEKARRMSRRPKKAKEAEALIKEILSDFPKMGEIRMTYARLLRKQRRLDEAEVLMREGVEISPEATLMKSHLAEVLAAQGRFAEAYDLAKVIHDQVPGDDLARYAMLRYLRGQGKTDEAIALGEGWLKADPDNRGLQAQVGEMYVLDKNSTQGIPLLEASLQDDLPRANVHRSLAMVAFAGGKLEEAIDHLVQEALWFPQRPDVRLELGNAYMKQERWDEAAAEFAMLTRLAPRRPEGRRLWAQAVFNAGAYQEAADILKPALKMFPDDPYVLLLQANILDKLGRSEEAKAVFAEAQAMHQALREQLEADGVPLIELDRDDDLPDLDELNE